VLIIAFLADKTSFTFVLLLSLSLLGKLSETLLQSAKKAVDEMCGPQKKFCLIDGVGYPAVGSITGTSNGEVASACGASVLLVGGKGVGDAVDTFNLNATYFSSRSVPVIGAIFNRLPSSGYYSLENCKNAVTSYFEQYGEGRSVFGFVPECQDGKKEFDMESFLESVSEESEENSALLFSKRMR